MSAQVAVLTIANNKRNTRNRGYPEQWRTMSGSLHDNSAVVNKAMFSSSLSSPSETWNNNNKNKNNTNSSFRKRDSPIQSKTKKVVRFQQDSVCETIGLWEYTKEEWRDAFYRPDEYTQFNVIAHRVARRIVEHQSSGDAMQQQIESLSRGLETMIYKWRVIYSQQPAFTRAAVAAHAVLEQQAKENNNDAMRIAKAYSRVNRKSVREAIQRGKIDESIAKQIMTPRN